MGVAFLADGRRGRLGDRGRRVAAAALLLGRPCNSGAVSTGVIAATWRGGGEEDEVDDEAREEMVVRDEEGDEGEVRGTREGGGACEARC